jgi:hypothetical protein
MRTILNKCVDRKEKDVIQCEGKSEVGKVGDAVVSCMYVGIERAAGLISNASKDDTSQF